MNKKDLLKAIGRINEKYMIEAEERADSNAKNSISLNDDCKSERVGIMDEKKYFKKKLEPFIAVAAAVILCVGSLIYLTQRNNDDRITSQDNSAVTSQSEQNNDPNNTDVHNKNRIQEMLPYKNNNHLYFGATITVNQPWQCDFELRVNVFDLDKGVEGIGEHIPKLSQTITQNAVKHGESITLKVAIDYDEIPDNIAVLCSVICFEYSGDEDDMPIEVHQLLSPQCYSKDGDIFNGNINSDESDDIGDIFYEDNYSNSMTDGIQIDAFFANNSEDIIQNDYEQIHGLCTKVCSVLANISHGKETESLAEYLVNSDLETYLNYEFSNLPIRLNDSNSMVFSITSYEINNGIAFVTGNYQNSTSSEGPFVFIIENSEGKLIVNDLICMFMDSADYAYRSEIVNIPKADFWKDPANYSDILRIINE